MFGIFGKPVWTLVFRNQIQNLEFHLCSDSIGKVLGYIDYSLEHQQVPAEDWQVYLQHKRGSQILVGKNNLSTKKIIVSSLKIDPKLRRSNSEPFFYEISGSRKRRLSLNSSIEGQAVTEMSLDQRIKAAETGLKETTSIHHLVRSVFDKAAS